MSVRAGAMEAAAPLMEIVRWGLGLRDAEEVAIEPVTRHSKFNYVYRVSAGGRIVYLKIAAGEPKRFATQLPRERIFSEAEAVRRFGALTGGHVLVPEVLFVDSEYYALALSDVGDGRRVLIDVLDESYDLLTEQAETLGRALGAVHAATRGAPPLRPPTEDRVVRRVIYKGLLAPGAEAVFPDRWPEIAAEMRDHEECLVHADLWSKNLLVRSGEAVAVVDFEGAFRGDPAFDLATLWAVALIPVIERPELASAARGFITSLLTAWLDESRQGPARGRSAEPGRDRWRERAAARSFRYTAVFLAARGFGPFAYEMSAGARSRLGALARGLAASAPDDPETFARFATRLRGPVLSLPRARAGVGAGPKAG